MAQELSALEHAWRLGAILCAFVSCTKKWLSSPRDRVFCRESAGAAYECRLLVLSNSYFFLEVSMKKHLFPAFVVLMGMAMAPSAYARTVTWVNHTRNNITVKLKDSKCMSSAGPNSFTIFPNGSTNIIISESLPCYSPDAGVKWTIDNAYNSFPTYTVVKYNYFVSGQSIDEAQITADKTTRLLFSARCSNEPDTCFRPRPVGNIITITITPTAAALELMP